jgi:hypothetical protein
LACAAAEEAHYTEIEDVCKHFLNKLAEPSQTTAWSPQHGTSRLSLNPLRPAYLAQ